MSQETDRQKALRLLQDDVTGYGARRRGGNAQELRNKIREDLTAAVEAMQQAGILLIGPRYIDPQNGSRTIPHTYTTLKAKIQQAEISELMDISNSLLRLHLDELQRTQGGRRKRRAKKTRRTRKHHHRSRRAKRS